MTDVIAGRFALCDPIARGGSGVVWRAWDRKTGRLCAAKVLRRRDAGDLLRFVREQSVRVNGPHVLTPYSWAAEDAHVVIASELVDGGSLATLMDGYGPLSEPTVAAVLDQLLAGLGNVHAAGLIHRDVKPANVLMRATGTGPVQALLSDFGLAVGAQDARLTQVGMVVGTPGYLPPELLHSAAAPHPVHDLYAAGQVAAALINGAEPPRRVAPPDLSRLRPGPLRDLLAALTAADPDRRPQTAGQARTWLRAGPVEPRPRTRAGAPIEVRHQLPPLDATAVPESVPLATPEPPAAGRTSGRRAAHGSDPRRRRVAIISSAGAAALLAVGIPVGITAADRSPGGTPHPSGNANLARTLRTVVVGDTCGWQDEGDPAGTPSGQAVTCTLANGRYLWTSD